MSPSAKIGCLGVVLQLAAVPAEATNQVFQCEIEGKTLVLRRDPSAWMPSLTPGCTPLQAEQRLGLPLHPPQPRPLDWPVMLFAPRQELDGVTQAVSSAAPMEVQQAVREHARRNGLQPELVLAVIRAESAFNPMARSAKGALGLMQVLPSTARDYGLDRSEDLLSAEPNIRIGTEHLARLVRKFDGDLHLALAAYNAGEGAVARHGWRVPPFPETERYVQTVMRSLNND